MIREEIKKVVACGSKNTATTTSNDIRARIIPFPISMSRKNQGLMYKLW